MRFDLLCIGDINLDVITQPIEKIPRAPQVIKEVKIVRGGSAANCAAFGARLGLKTAFMGKLSTDEFGDWLLGQMREVGVRCFVRREKASIGVTIALTRKQGGRNFITYRGTNKLLKIQDLNLRLLRRTRHLHRAGFWHTEGLFSSNKQIFSIAREKGAQTSLDIGWDYGGWKKDRRKLVLKLLPYLDVLFLNREEALRLSQRRSIKMAKDYLLRKGVRMVCIHLGKRGSALYIKKEKFKSDAFRVAVVNPTGAGDAFNAGFIYGMLQGWNWEKTLRFANGVAALHISKLEDHLPTLQEVRRFLGWS
jgi:sugar/nucleoside kinase (ribokinase family)